MAVCLLITTGVPMLSVQPKGKQKGCAGCNRKIKDRYLLKALDKYWHEDCLKCACCDCRLGEVGSTLYTKANLILCRRDYLRQERRTITSLHSQKHKSHAIPRAVRHERITKVFYLLVPFALVSQCVFPVAPIHRNIARITAKINVNYAQIPQC